MSRKPSHGRVTDTGRAFDPLVFWVSASLTILFVLWAAILPDSMESVVNTVFDWTTQSWGWLYLWTVFLLVLAMFVSGRETPGRNLRAFWGIALGAVAAVLAATGSLQVIQTASIATAFPLMFLLLVVIYGTFKGLSEYRQNQARTSGAVEPEAPVM